MAIFAYIILFFIFGGVFLLVSGIGAEKVCTCILASKLKMKSYGLIWVPFVGSWKESTLVGKLLGMGNWPRIVLFILKISVLILFLITAASWEINGSVSDFALYALILLYPVAYVVKGIFYVMMMNKYHVGIFTNLVFSFIIQPFWPCVMMKRVKVVSKT